VVEHIAPEPVEERPFIEQPVLPESPQSERPQADLDGLQHAVERTIAAMDSFVQTELSAVRDASMLEVDEIHRERERLLEEAGEAARAHLDETRVRAERIVEEARHDGDEMRRRIESELNSERERFEHVLAERDAEAQARVEAVLAEAEDRRREADERVSEASRVQAKVLASIDKARDSLYVSAGQPAVEPVQVEAQEEDSWGPPAELPRPMSLQSLIAEQRADSPVESEPAGEPVDEADATDAAA
jgi:vacuolar-type H+-ATPase subunit I/STV1